MDGAADVLPLLQLIRGRSGDRNGTTGVLLLIPRRVGDVDGAADALPSLQRLWRQRERRGRRALLGSDGAALMARRQQERHGRRAPFALSESSGNNGDSAHAKLPLFWRLCNGFDE